MSQLAEAECDYLVRRAMMIEGGSKLVRAAMKGYISYRRGTRLPDGFRSAGLLTDNESVVAGARLEALISLYLDGIYIVRGRLIHATKAINEVSGNTLWPNVKNLHGGARGRDKDAIWLNLLTDLRGVGSDEATAADRFDRACRIRGTRTHERHFDVHLEHDPADEYPVVHYASENAYRTTAPHTSFSAKDRAGYGESMMLVLKWWQERTLTQLPSSAT